MPDPVDVVVTGKLNHAAILDFMAGASEGGGPSGGAGGVSGGTDGGGGASDSGWMTLPIPGTTLKVVIPIAEWAAMPNNMKYALAHVLLNYADSPNLKASFDYYVSQGVSAIEVHYGPRGVLAGGGTYSFVPNALMQVDAPSFDSSTSKTDLVTGKPIVISINSEAPVLNDLKAVATAFIHELLHPFVPDVVVSVRPDGSQVWDDHQLLQDPVGQPGTGLVSVARSDIFGDIDWFAPLPDFPVQPGNGHPGSPEGEDPDGPLIPPTPIEGGQFAWLSLDEAQRPSLGAWDESAYYDVLIEENLLSSPLSPHMDNLHI